MHFILGTSWPSFHSLERNIKEVMDVPSCVPQGREREGTKQGLYLTVWGQHRNEGQRAKRVEVSGSECVIPEGMRVRGQQGVNYQKQMWESTQCGKQRKDAELPGMWGKASQRY